MMQVHFIGLGEINMLNLAVALYKKGATVTGSEETFNDSLASGVKERGQIAQKAGWFTDKIHDRLDAVVFGPNVKPDNPELLKAKELNLNILTCSQFLFEQTKLKTRVVIAGTNNSATVAAMVFHVCVYNEIEVDYVLSKPTEIRLTDENDFVIIDGGNVIVEGGFQLQSIPPNIALLSDIYYDETSVQPDFENYAETYGKFVDSVVKGGSITYNEEDVEVKKRVEASENPIRKFPYSTPAYQVMDGEVFVDTPDGEMPLKISGQEKLRCMAGAKWICQQMGIDEVEFYEAMATFG